MSAHPRGLDLNPGSFDPLELIEARENLTGAVLRRVAHERDRPHAYYDAQLEYDDECIDAFVRNYAVALGLIPDGVVNAEILEGDGS